MSAELQYRRGGAQCVAIVGTGEMGSAIGRRLRERGATVRTSLRDRSAASASRVERAGLEVRNDDDALIAQADFLLSIVPPAQAISVAQRFHGPLSRTPTKPVYVECNAISPKAARQIAELLKDTDCPFVDAGIIGGPPSTGPDGALKGPRIYACGPSAQRFGQLSEYGLDIEVLPDSIGAASALKMCYAGLTKGLTALGTIMIGAAANDNLAGVLGRELAQSQPEMLELLRQRIPGMLPKAYRWVGEMEEIAAYLGAENAGALIFKGASQIYARIAREVGRNPEDEELSKLLSFCAGRDD
jgi:L-threonate 2-dehydrogenase